MVKNLRIVNVVASTFVQSTIDIEKLAMMLKQVNYEPEVFPGLIYRRQNPKATVIMFASGKITSVGTDSENQARRAIRTTVEEIKRLGGLMGSCKLNSINIENVVGTLDLGLNIDLNKLALILPNAIYETEQFPGLIYRPSSRKEVVLIFASGKLVATGAKNELRLRQLLKEVYKIISRTESVVSRDSP
jgi:transcription initiation factor TFIID TATA-box-binding protein